MEHHGKAALNATREMHKRLKAISKNTQQASAIEGIGYLMKLSAEANRAVQAMQRSVQDERMCASVRENVLRQSVRDDLIDREANAARIQERQRTTYDGNEKGLHVWERSNQVVAAVESSVAALCPHRAQRTAGVALLAVESERMDALRG